MPGMKDLAGVTPVHQVIGRNRLNWYSFYNLNISVFHDNGASDSLGAYLCQHQGGFVRAHQFQGRRVKMVTVMVSENDNIRLGQLRIICKFAEGVDMDDHAVISKHQRTMSDEGDLKVPPDVLITSFSNCCWPATGEIEQNR